MEDETTRMSAPPIYCSWWEYARVCLIGVVAWVLGTAFLTIVVMIVRDLH